MMTNNNTGIVYWIHHPHHVDMWTEGYIGYTSKQASHRFKKHIERMKDNKRITKLGNAMKKYGPENLIMKTILVGYTDYCLDIERLFRPLPGIGWNTGCGGSKTTLGRRATKEQREHFSKVHSGRRHTEEWKAMMSEKFKGRKFRLGGKMPPSAIAKIVAAHKGSKHTEETKRKMSESAKNRWALKKQSICYTESFSGGDNGEEK